MLSFFKKLNRYSIMASGDFEKIFAEFQVPSCPEVVSRLLRKVKEPDVSMDEVALLIEADPGLGTQLLKMVNSALFGLPGKVSSVAKAVSMVGLKEIANLAISYAMAKVVKPPKVSGFDVRLFWRHSLFRGVLARSLARRAGLEPDDAFTAGLMQDIALPILLTDWFDVYRRVYEQWLEGKDRLHRLETRELSWNHAQAGAWIAKNWELPDLLVCAIGFHVLPNQRLEEMGLLGSVVGIAAMVSDAPRALEGQGEMDLLLQRLEPLGLGPHRIQGLMEEAAVVVEELARELGV